MDKTVRERILNILSEICETEEIRRNPDLELFSTGLLDSFAIIQLFAAIQEELNLDISPTEVERQMWATPNLIIHYLEERMAS